MIESNNVPKSTYSRYFHRLPHPSLAYAIALAFTRHMLSLLLASLIFAPACAA
ncbi:hypothetical protein HHK36_002334 [Tetracentron sinense]|uniref:Uncharacterized protein n=1 Tax=Tetracentron sinense TaxID=13715 RepID=A0A835DSW3_TETSI|nr:hypothetical protein HHK36_002334 [Tetracentron sinense]